MNLIHYVSAAMLVSALSMAGCSAPKTDGVAVSDSTPSAAAKGTADAPATPVSMVVARPAVAHVTSVEEAKAVDGKEAPNFTWVTADGKEHTLKDYRGRVVMLNFWGTWCPPCRMELPDIVKIREELAAKGSFEVIGLNVGEDYAKDDGSTSIETRVANFAEKNGIKYPLALANEDLVKAYGDIQSVPTTIILNKNGEITARMIGMKQEKDFRDAIEKAM